MSARRVAEAVDDGFGATVSTLSDRSPVSVRPLAAALGLVPVAGTALYRVAHNAPVSLPASVGELAALLLPVAATGPAFAGLLLASAADRPSERVGLAFVGGFGLVAIASPRAWYPAAAGVVCGGVLAVGARAARSRRRERPETARYPAVAAVVVAAVAASLAATAGVAPATLRPLGSALALLGVGLAPLLVGTDPASLLAGAAAGGATLLAATGLPYVTGAALLVGGGVVGTPLPVVVFGVGGGVAAVVAAVRRRRLDRACGAGLLLAAGVPGTLLQALGVVVGVVLLAGGSGGESA